MITSVEELTFLHHYKRPEKQHTVNEIKKALPFIEEEEMKNFAHSVLEKLEGMSEEDYQQIDYKNIIDTNDDNELQI